jgi:hypothetical protein
MVPMAPLLLSVYHRLPSGPFVMTHGLKKFVDVNSVIAPAVVMRPIFPELNSVNQSAPSDPSVIEKGPLFAVGVAYSVIPPDVVMRPIFDVPFSANHNAPSGPAAM